MIVNYQRKIVNNYLIMLLTLVKLLRDIIDDHVINVSLNFCYGSMTLAPYCIQFSDSTETEKQIQ